MLPNRPNDKVARKAGPGRWTAGTCSSVASKTWTMVARALLRAGVELSEPGLDLHIADYGVALYFAVELAYCVR